MKKKIMALIMALTMAGFVSAIDVNDNLSINGFIDASYQDTETNDVDGQQLGVDEVEVDFLFNAGGVSAELHLDDDGVSSWDIEQVFMSYALEGGLTVTIGRYGSALGLEREDPGGLYSTTRAYTNAFNYGDVDGRGDASGVILSYGTDLYSIAASFENPTMDAGGLDADDLDLELSLSYTGIENLTIGGGLFFDNAQANDASGLAGDAGETDIINVHAAYTSGKALIGLEYSQNDTSGSDKTAAVDLNGETDAYMVLVDYDVSDKLGVALRYSSEETGTGVGGDRDVITIAPNYVITESLGAILEYSDIDNDTATGRDDSVLAFELTFTF